MAHLAAALFYGIVRINMRQWSGLALVTEFLFSVLDLGALQGGVVR